MTQATQTIPAGYKQTEIGVIPEDWVMERLGQLINYKNGKSFEKFIVENGKYKLITLNSLDINGKLKKEHLQVNIYDSSLNKDDLIMILSDVAHGNFLGLTDLVPENDKYVLNQRVGALKNVKKVKPYLLSKYINYHQKYFKTAGQGSSQLNLSKGDIVNFIVSFPSNPKEQTAIATALSDTDALIEKLEKLITKKKAIKQGAMQQLLTGKKRLPGFSGEWEVKTIKQMELIPVSDGPHLTPQFVGRGIPFLSVNNLVNNKISFVGMRYITKEDHAEFSKKCKPQDGDILLGKAASVGLVAVANLNCEFNIWSPIAVIRLKTEYNPKFFLYLFQTQDTTRSIKLLTNSSSQGNLGMGDIEKIEFKVPLFNEQTAIATVLSDMDAEIEKLENKLGKYRQIKTGMMQQLLTGKIRLI